MFKGRRRSDGTAITLHTHIPHDDPNLLLRQIQSMPKEGRTAISFDEAAAAFEQAFFDFAELPESTRESVQKMSDEWIAWVSSQGYWIELKGNEYGCDEEIDLKEVARSLNVESRDSCLRIGLMMWQAAVEMGPKAEEIYNCLPEGAFKCFWLETLGTSRWLDVATGIVKSASLQEQQRLVTPVYLGAIGTLLELAEAGESALSPHDFYVDRGMLRRFI